MGFRWDLGFRTVRCAAIQGGDLLRFAKQAFTAENAEIAEEKERPEPPRH